MHTTTGELITGEALSVLPSEERFKYVEVQRPLTYKEKFDMQIRKYSLCGCGSGKKFKFCCYKKI